MVLRSSVVRKHTNVFDRIQDEANVSVLLFADDVLT